MPSVGGFYVLSCPLRGATYVRERVPSFLLPLLPRKQDFPRASVALESADFPRASDALESAAWPSAPSLIPHVIWCGCTGLWLHLHSCCPDGLRRKCMVSRGGSLVKGRESPPDLGSSFCPLPNWCTSGTHRQPRKDEQHPSSHPQRPGMPRHGSTCLVPLPSLFLFPLGLWP